MTFIEVEGIWVNPQSVGAAWLQREYSHSTLKMIVSGVKLDVAEMPSDQADARLRKVLERLALGER